MKVLFEAKEVQQLLNDYQHLVGVRIAVFDTDFNELFSSPKTLSSFCMEVRKNSKIKEACKYCDAKAFRQVKANSETYLYKCHLGLYECIAPLYDQDQIIGYVMIGQVLDTSGKNFIWKNLEKYDLKDINNLALAKEKFMELKQMSTDEIQMVSRIMKACANSIWLQHIIDIQRSPISDRIENYIVTHFSETIDTKSICSALNISKTTIYNYLKNEFNMSLTAYIHHIRLEYSKTLLEENLSSIADVACEVGYADYNYYSRLFKKKYGMTPRDYLKKYTFSKEQT